MNTFRVLKIISYSLAGLVLVLGLIVGLNLLISTANISNLLLPLQLMGADVIINIITPILNGFVRGLGVTVLVITFVLSLLLFVAGRLLGYIISLEARLASLEAQMETAL
jgi:hypothetical protein